MGRPCAECKAWLYEDYSDRLSNVKIKRGPRKEPQRRPPGVPTPCWICPKIPKEEEKKPENAIELSDKNWQALVWYYEARAAGLTDTEKEDSICRRNMGIIDPIVRRHEIEVGTLKAVAALMKAR